MTIEIRNTTVFRGPNIWARMPAILMESLAFSSPDELALIVDPAVRTQMAVAYADGIGRFFASRSAWVRQELAAADHTEVSVP